MKWQMIQVVLLMSLAGIAQASDIVYQSDEAEAIRLARYTQLRNIPPVDQRNPLKVVIQTEIPQAINTIREAVRFLLIRSGYQLADDAVMSREAQKLLSLTLPQVHRRFGPMTLDEVLSTLAGESYSLLVDPVHRKIGYELTSNLEAR